MDLRKAPSRGGFGGGNASFAQTTMINNKEKTNDSFLEEEEDDLKGVRHFLRLSDKDEEDEVEESKMLWDNLVSDLKQVLGAS